MFTFLYKEDNRLGISKVILVVKLTGSELEAFYIFYPPFSESFFFSISQPQTRAYIEGQVPKLEETYSLTLEFPVSILFLLPYFQNFYFLRKRLYR